MHIYSFILLVFTVWNLFGKRSKEDKLINQTAFVMFVYVFTNCGYFLISEAINIDYYQAALVLLFVVTLLTGAKGHVSKYFLIYFGCLTISFLFLLFFPSKSAEVVGAAGGYEYFISGVENYFMPEFTKFSVFYYVLAVMQGYIVDRIAHRFNYASYENLIHNTAKWVKISVICAGFEFVIKNVFGSTFFQDLLRVFFGYNKSVSTGVNLRGLFASLQGLNRESSHFAYAMGIAVIVFFAEYKLSGKKENKWWGVLATIFVLLSRAFSMLLVLVLLIGLYFLYKMYIDNLSKDAVRRLARVFFSLFVIVVLVVVGIVVILKSDSYIVKRIERVYEIIRSLLNGSFTGTATQATTDSSLTRLYSVLHTLGNFLCRPLFGIGIATTYCHGATALTLAEIGMLGMISYLRCYYGTLMKKTNERKLCIYTIFLWMVVNLLASGAATRFIVQLDGLLIVICMICLAQKRDTKHNQCE